MKRCYLVGIGGTGSKCLESFIHLACSGLAPEEVWIGMVDVDKENGNLERTTQLLECYKSLYKSLRTGKNRLADSPLLKTEFVSPSTGAFWSPLPDGVKDLKQLFRYEQMRNETKWLFDSLFDHKEQETDLNHGFRGRPAMGSAVLLSQAIEGHEFWNEILESVQKVKAGDEIRIFLIASAFGGTGSAGFPTIARLIREEIKKRNIRQNYYVGGILLMPYFQFPSKESDEITANAEAFLENAQASLKYYHHLLSENENLFDNLYLFGWDPLTELKGEPEKGGTKQKNPPLMPEFFASLAALKFFQSDELSHGRIFRTGYDITDKQFTWNIIPGINDRTSVKEYMGQLVRFAFAYLSSYRPFLYRETFSQIKDQKWFRNLIKEPGVSLEKDECQNILESLDSYCQDMLRWIASVSYLTNTDRKINLFRVSAFANKTEDDKNPVELLPNFKKQDFSSLVIPGNAPALHEIYRILSEEAKPDPETQGLGVFCNTLYDLCKI